MQQNTQIDPKRYSRYYTYVKPIISDPVVTGYFGLVASVLLCAFFIIFAVSPTISTILGLTKKIDEQKQLIKSMDAKISSLITAQENYSQIEPFINLLYLALPKSALPQDIINGVVPSASISAVSVSSLQISAAQLAGQEPKSAQNIPAEGKNTEDISVDVPKTLFSVGTTGIAANLRQFASRLQNLSRIITLSEMSIVRNELSEGSSQNTLSSDIKGAVYYLK